MYPDAAHALHRLGALSSFLASLIFRCRADEPEHEVVMESIWDHVWYFSIQAGALVFILLPLLAVAAAVYWYARWRRHARLVEESLDRLLMEIEKLRDDRRTGS